LQKRHKKEYLGPDLNLIKMYFLYKEACATESPVSLSIYRRTFNHEYNIGFHHPIKDQCDLCISFKHAPEEQRVSMTDTIETH